MCCCALRADSKRNNLNYYNAMITGDVIETTIGMTGLTIAAAATGWGLPSVAMTSAAVGVYKVVKLLWRIQRRLPFEAVSNERNERSTSRRSSCIRKLIVRRFIYSRVICRFEVDKWMKEDSGFAKTVAE
ncbi:Uncharacterized protein FWK35_00010581 [Aphis craccivora]|uniref:Uncharacterized protein n=1 Tax=Aphis craccivora TaxID=307492 RepID=A0A6G0ZQ37_APHCR|nr:Uncharacterized protein FWK35_00010581 [Aphis craccivora]